MYPRKENTVTATVVTFRRDLKKLLAELTTFDPKITVQQLHDRHEQIRLARQEAYSQRDAGFITIQDIYPITYAMDSIDTIAYRAGVPRHVIDEFNKNRWDWISYRRASKAWKRVKAD